MTQYNTKLKLIILIGIIFAIVIQIQRSGISINYSMKNQRNVVKKQEVNSIDTAPIKGQEKFLILYDKEDQTFMRFQKNIERNLEYMKAPYDAVDISDVKTKNYGDYTAIILVVQNFETKVGKEIYNIIGYVEDGGKLLVGVVPSAIGTHFKSIDEKLGITELSNYKKIQGIYFPEELIPGIKGKSFEDEEAFGDYVLNVKLEDTCKVYMESYGEQDIEPLLWEKDLESGKIVFYNGGTLGDDHYGGIFAGAVAVLKEDFLYPVINAKTVFIDDFPAPEYNIDSPIIEENYNRTVRAFYRDIWWPDMEKAAKRYNVAYTGLFIATYNNIVNPKNFVFREDPMMQYYGNGLLKNGFEIGLHGYNHQPLVPMGWVPKEIGYKPWASEQDMEASLKELIKDSSNLFPKIKFESYVPPSNYLSPQGREALIKAVPDLKIISGLYSQSKKAAEREGQAYVQKFEVAKDGIVEFPRITAGMWHDEEIVFQYMNGLALHGVFSHFIHPDDILDKERGRNKDWETLLDQYSKILKDVNILYKSIRPLKAREAAQAVEVFDHLNIKVDYAEDGIKGACDHFYGEAFFYLRTDKKPIVVDDSCTIEAIGSDKAKQFYFITIKKSIFQIKLENK